MAIPYAEDCMDLMSHPVGIVFAGIAIAFLILFRRLMKSDGDHSVPKTGLSIETALERANK